MRAEVHLTAYKQRIVPIIHGDVIQVSADRLTDPKTNNPYYVASVRMDQAELAALPNIQALSGYAGDRNDPDGTAYCVRLSGRPAGDVIQPFVPAEINRSLWQARSAALPSCQSLI